MATGRKLADVTEAGTGTQIKVCQTQSSSFTHYATIKEEKTRANHGIKLPALMIYVPFIIRETQRNIVMCWKA